MSDMVDYYLDSSDPFDFNPISELCCKFCGTPNLHWKATREITIRGVPVGRDYRLFTRNHIIHNCNKYISSKH